MAGSGRGAALTSLHRLFVSKRFAAAASDLDLKLGRFERSDAAGLYTLDGLSLGWRRGTARWELFGGAPRRTEIYAIPGRSDSSLDRPAGRRLAGAQVRITPADGRLGALEATNLGLGLRHYWSGTSATRLDGRFSAVWRPLEAQPPVDLDAAVSLAPKSGGIESFDAQARMRSGESGQLFLRGRRYEPPDDPVTFRDRYYRFYARGRQTVVEGGYRGRPTKALEWSADLRHIVRELGGNGSGGSLSLEWGLARGSRLEGRVEWLEAGEEHARGLFAGLWHPLNSRLLLTGGAALRGDRSLVDGDKTVLAGEMKLKWMWRRDLTLSALLEMTRVESDIEDYSELRFGLRLVYRLPGTDVEDYR